MLLGLALMLGGGLFALAAWFILEYMPLAALGMSGVMIGVVSLALGKSLPRISPEASLMLLEPGFDNIAGLVEELGLRDRAIYLPTSLSQGRLRALIPLHRSSAPPVVRRQIEQRFIARFGPGPEDYGILVAGPGSPALRLVEVPESGSSTDLEGALSALLVGTLNLVSAVGIGRNGDTVVVRVAHPILPPRDHPAYTVLGSPIASIAATIVAESLDRPVTVVSETSEGRWHLIELKLQPEAIP